MIGESRNPKVIALIFIGILVLLILLLTLETRSGLVFASNIQKIQHNSLSTQIFSLSGSLFKACPRWLSARNIGIAGELARCLNIRRLIGDYP